MERRKDHTPRPPHVEFRVELRDETLGPLGSDTVGTISFNETRLRRRFQKANIVEREMELPAADEQVLAMRRLKTLRNPTEEQLMNRMGQAGFVAHRFPDGGAVWLAFCDIDNESNGVMCGFCSHGG